MNPLTLGGTAATFLAPYLVKAGEKTAEDVGKRLPDVPGKIWHPIMASSKGKPVAEDAVKDFVAQPEDEDNRAALRKELRKTLEAHPAFAQELGVLLERAQRQGSDSIIVTGCGAAATRGGVAAGEGGVAVREDVHGGINTGRPEKKG